MHLLFRDATLIHPGAQGAPPRGDLRVRDGLIAEIGPGLPSLGAEEMAL